MEPIILHIETATEICSVALSRGKQLIALKEESKGLSHAEKLIPFIEELVKSNQLQISDINAVAVSIGPGSYTGLRIGASTAKGLCYALDIPVITISTLKSIAIGAQQDRFEIEKPYLLAPMIDARRMEVYTTLYSSDMELMNEIHAEIIDEESFKEILEQNIVIFCGNGMSKSKELLSRYPNAMFSESPLSAQNMILMAYQKFENEDFDDLPYFEPFYLKDYLPGKSTVKGLR
ncbi:MAG: tsaB [Bacteroidetes bacterium]|nr:tsaB [Bacteroidota bacterium]